MLILTRKESETIVIGDDVRITLLGIKGKVARLGITAPKEVSVMREELLEHANKPEQSNQGETDVSSTS